MVYVYYVVVCVCVCRNNLVTITELLESMRKLQNISDSRKYEMIAQVLDEDHDGVINKTDVMEVIIFRVYTASVITTRLNCLSAP